MKLSWKLFFITTPIFMVFLTLFGTWMIQDSFQGSFEREVQRCMVENQMFQNSYELTKNALSEEQREQASVKKIVESFYHKHNEKGENARVLGADGTVLYQENDLEIPHHIQKSLQDDRNVGYEVLQEDGAVYVAVLCRSSFGEYIETIKNVTDVFENRSLMYSRYQLGVLFLAVLVGCVILLVLFFVMRNMQKLSRATRQFARGNYKARVAIKSRDEIGMLAEDFNWMANAMNVQIQQLQEEVRRQEEFTAAFAHELKTPLTSIIGYADTIRQMELSPEETDMCADYIYRQGKRLQSLSYKLLELTLAGKQEITCREIYVPDFLQEIKRMVGVSIAQKQLMLSVQAEAGMIYGDKELLAYLFINLIDNARKASEPGKHIWLTGTSKPGGYMVSVIDEGRGISKEELSRIAEPFYMVDKSRARKEGGAGLGLALCRKIIELHHGSWQLSSEPGMGLRVDVLFGYPEAPDRKGMRIGRKNKKSRKAPQEK